LKHSKQQVWVVSSRFLIAIVDHGAAQVNEGRIGAYIFWHKFGILIDKKPEQLNSYSLLI
jgi:hypothetical protein